MLTIPDRFRNRTSAILASMALFAIGGGIGAAAMHAFGPVAVMAPTKPVPISSLAGLTEPLFGERIVAVQGKIAEIYGSRFVLADASGRALIETGRGGMPAAGGQTVTVQGRYDDGVLHARFVVGADGTVTALHSRRGTHHRHGDRHGGSREQTEPVVTPPVHAPGTPAAARPTQG